MPLNACVHASKCWDSIGNLDFGTPKWFTREDTTLTLARYGRFLMSNVVPLKDGDDPAGLDTCSVHTSAGKVGLLQIFRQPAQLCRTVSVRESQLSTLLVFWRSAEALVDAARIERLRQQQRLLLQDASALRDQLRGEQAKSLFCRCPDGVHEHLARRRFVGTQVIVVVERQCQICSAQRHKTSKQHKDIAAVIISFWTFHDAFSPGAESHWSRGRLRKSEQPVL